MLQKRIPYIDLAAGIMILWMIIYHAFCYTSGVSFGRSEESPCISFPYLSFFMPWFFYKSGQFFEKRSYKELFRKDARKLLLTFAIWSAIGYVFYLIIGALQQSLTLRGATYSIVRGLFLTGKVPINEPLWFLLTLFGVRFVANWLLPNKDNKFRWLIVVCIVIVGYIIAYGCFRWNHPLLPYWVANGASGLVFFALGYEMRDYESKWWLMVPSVVAYFICCIVGFPMVDMIFNKLLAGNYLLWIPVALCGIVVFNALCRWMCKYIRLKPIELVGQNAMTIYVTHILIVLTCTFVVEYFDMTLCYPYMLWIILGAYTIFLPVLCYLLPKTSVFRK